jgi:hypothetical protein
LALAVSAIIGLLLVGAPMRASAVAAGSRRPMAEGVAFAIVCAAAALTYAYVFSPDTGPNINTTATMAARQRYFSAGPHFPPELVWGFWLTVSAAILGGIAAAFLGAPSSASRKHHFGNALRYSLSVAASLLLGFIFLGVFGPFMLAASGPAAILGPVVQGLLPVMMGGVLAGVIVGALTTSARSRLQAAP